MPLNFPLRAALKAGQRAAGAWLTLPSTAIARTLAHTQGVSWVVIDAEHGLISDPHYYDLTNAIASSGASPIIRIPGDEPWQIKRALDSGAHGVMVPLANSVEIVRKVVSACKYPPQGIRGFGPMFTHAAGELGGAYKAGANENVVVIVQIEHPNALKEIDAILQEGVDVVFIGPFDLSVTMGVDFDGKEHRAAIQRVLEAAHNAKKTAAIFCLNGDQAAARFNQGFDMVSVSTDIDTLTDSFANHLSKVTGDAPSAVSGYST